MASEGSGCTGNLRLMRGGDKRDGGSDQVVVSEGSGRKKEPTAEARGARNAPVETNKNNWYKTRVQKAIGG